MRHAAWLVLALGCSRAEIKEFHDGFDRAALGLEWTDTGGSYRVVGGEVVVARAYNHPLWLRPRLPRDAEITFDVWSQSPDGDIKVELWGDGESAASDKGAYTATGYVLIFGGWKNRLTVLARMDEHGADRKARSDMKVVPGKKYRWRVVRKGSRLSWWIDGQAVFEMDDVDPLEGPGHEHFGLNDWEVELHFDNLRIRAL